LICASWSDSEIGVAHVRLRLEILKCSGEADGAAFEDYSFVGDQPGEVQVLLRDEDAKALIFKLEDRLGHLFDDARRYPLRRLVQHEQQRIYHQRPPDSQHLLLAPAHRAARPAPHLGELRE
jgi:hypothetical protein